MPTWTSQDLRNYEARRLPPSPKPQQPVQDGTVGKDAGEEENPSKIHVRVRSFSVRLTDPDNLCPKYFIDCLRYAGLIPDDNPEVITLEVSQEKVSHKKDERAEIEISLLPPDAQSSCHTPQCAGKPHPQSDSSDHPSAEG